MKRNKGFSLILVLVLVAAAVAIGFLVYQNIQLRKQSSLSSPTPTPIATLASTPTPAPTLRAGWKIYKNEQYGFEFSYPETYKVLTDSQNLYGWPKAILLLYKGGQSYDMAVEVWSTEAEYKTKYKDASSYTVFKTAGGKFITLLNANKDTEVAEIIATFKFTN